MTGVSREQFDLLMRAVGNIHLRVKALEEKGKYYQKTGAINPKQTITQELLDELERSPGLEG